MLQEPWHRGTARGHPQLPCCSQRPPATPVTRGCLVKLTAGPCARHAVPCPAPAQDPSPPTSPCYFQQTPPSAGPINTLVATSPRPLAARWLGAAKPRGPCKGRQWRAAGTPRSRPTVPSLAGMAPAPVSHQEGGNRGREGGSPKGSRWRVTCQAEPGRGRAGKLWGLQLGLVSIEPK